MSLVWFLAYIVLCLSRPAFFRNLDFALCRSLKMAAATLYYTPTSCGVASFIAAFKGGLIQSGKVRYKRSRIYAHCSAGPRRCSALT